MSLWDDDRIPVKENKLNKWTKAFLGFGIMAIIVFGLIYIGIFTSFKSAPEPRFRIKMNSVLDEIIVEVNGPYESLNGFVHRPIRGWQILESFATIEGANQYVDHLVKEEKNKKKAKHSWKIVREEY